MVKHIESWNVEPGAVVKSLLNPSARKPTNSWEKYAFPLCLTIICCASNAYVCCQVQTSSFRLAGSTSLSAARADTDAFMYSKLDVRDGES